MDQQIEWLQQAGLSQAEALAAAGANVSQWLEGKNSDPQERRP